MTAADVDWPRLHNVGVDGVLVSFSDRLSEPANRAALAFRAAMDKDGPDGIEESSTSLVSTYLRFDPLAVDHATMRSRLGQILMTRDWYQAALPGGRQLWRIPTVYGTELAPQLEEAAAVANVTPEQAIETISQTRVRVQTIGFAPGQPYLGELPQEWDIPRQTKLTDKVPIGALTVAIRQLVLFSVSTPTGWRHIGQTAFRAFRTDSDRPFLLRPGDEVLFQATDPQTYLNLQSGDPDGGAVCEPLQ
jgi:KipI family sensor histidine kinase inhibitor